MREYFPKNSRFHQTIIFSLSYSSLEYSKISFYRVIEGNSTKIKMIKRCIGSFHRGATATTTTAEWRQTAALVVHNMQFGKPSLAANDTAVFSRCDLLRQSRRSV